MSIVGEVREKKDCNRSSMPKEKQTLETLVKAKLTPQLIFKDGSRVLDVIKISNKRIESIIEGDFLVQDKTKYKYSFSGSAEICIQLSTDYSANPMKINGYFNRKSNNEIEIYSIIQIIGVR